MSVITNIYDPASKIEDAIASIFTSNSLTPSIPRTAAELQKTRPRVEIIFDVGAEKQSYHTFDDGTMRNATWFGQLRLRIIGNTATSGSGSGVTSFREIQATVAYLMSSMVVTLNTGIYTNNFGDHVAGDAYLDYHKVQRITGTAFAPQYKFEDGWLASDPVFAFEFGVDQGAWTELGLTPAT